MLGDYNLFFRDYYLANNEAYNDALHRGIRVDTVSLTEGDLYWRVDGVHLLTASENAGKHHIYADVLRNGSRVNGARLKIEKVGGKTEYAVIDKPAEEPGTNFPLYANDVATLSVDDSIPSERVTGLRTTYADGEPGNTWGHHSFYVVFQLARWAVATAAPGPADPQPGSPGGEPGFTGQQLRMEINGIITVRIIDSEKIAQPGG